MLTYTPNPKPKRKDRPWLLFLMALIWISGSCFFHDPWEPYEPYVVAIVKSIIETNSWLVPYLSSPSVPYLELQPFYFWIFAVIIKIFNFSNIANAVRLLNALIILVFIMLMGRIGSGLSAFKNGRTVVMILISMVGFINNAYQLSPHLIVLLGFALYLYALQRFANMPGAASGLMALGLICISLNFTAQYLFIALFILLILPCLSRHWRSCEYLIMTLAGCGLFLLVFVSYIYQLHEVDKEFFYLWQHQYLNYISLDGFSFAKVGNYLFMLLWYLIPGWFLVIWTLYRRGKQIFRDPIASVAIIMAILVFTCALFSIQNNEAAIFPILIPIVLLASLEIDSIKITIVSLFNWFNICTFGVAGLTIVLLYFALSFGYPSQLFAQARELAPYYSFNFNFWQVLLAAIITVIWLFMITRRHIRGREMISNWASGATFVAVMFMSLCIPWFNSVLSFQRVVAESMEHIKPDLVSCVATPSGNSIQYAIWYYYADIRLRPESNLNATPCQQIIIPEVSAKKPELSGWHIVWRGRRSVDFKTYYLLERD